MPGPRKTPVSVPIPKEAFSTEEPTAVGSDPIAALETIDRRLKSLARDHRTSVEVDQTEHVNIRTSVETLAAKVDASEEKLEKRIDESDRNTNARFDGLHQRLDFIANASLSVKVEAKQAEIKLNAEQQAADKRVDTEKKVAKISTAKELAIKIIGPFAGVLGALLAAYAAGFIHGC